MLRLFKKNTGSNKVGWLCSSGGLVLFSAVFFSPSNFWSSNPRPGDLWLSLCVRWCLAYCPPLHGERQAGGLQWRSERPRFSQHVTANPLRCIAPLSVADVVAYVGRPLDPLWMFHSDVTPRLKGYNPAMYPLDIRCFNQVFQVLRDLPARHPFVRSWQLRKRKRKTQEAISSSHSCTMSMLGSSSIVYWWLACLATLGFAKNHTAKKAALPKRLGPS